MRMKRMSAKQAMQIPKRPRYKATSWINRAFDSLRPGIDCPEAILITTYQHTHPIKQTKHLEILVKIDVLIHNPSIVRVFKYALGHDTRCKRQYATFEDKYEENTYVPSWFDFEYERNVESPLPFGSRRSIFLPIAPLLGKIGAA